MLVQDNSHTEKLRTTKSLIFLFALIFLVGIAASDVSANDGDSTDQASTSDTVTTNIRGVEQEERGSSHKMRSLLNTVFFVPRTALDAALVPMGYSIFLFGDTRLIPRIEEFFFINERPLGWYPIVNASTGEGFAFGAKVFYRQPPFGSSVGGYYRDKDVYLLNGDLEYGLISGKTVWQFGLSGKAKKREDYRFYGYGNDPQSDPRNTFKADAEEEYGVFAEKLVKFQFVAGMRPTDLFELFYTSLYQHRTLSIPDEESTDNIDNIFELSTIPGFDSGAAPESKQFYNEFAVRYDTREYQGALSPGIRIEGYMGLSQGVGDDSSKFSLAGISATVYFPIIKRNRLLVPQISFAHMNNINDETDVLFANYPRQLKFRGAGSQSFLRTDKITIVPSIEYEWPLSPLLKGNLFLDYLLVSNSIGDLSFSGAPYAYGIGVNIHSFHTERARLSIATGSEGFRLLLTFGLSNNANNRTNWE